MKLGVPYVDGEARIDVKDVLNQVKFYKSRNLVKPDVKAEPIIDKRYVVALPEK